MCSLGLPSNFYSRYWRAMVTHISLDYEINKRGTAQGTVLGPSQTLNKWSLLPLIMSIII